MASGAAAACCSVLMERPTKGPGPSRLAVADPQQRQPELQVGGVAYRCPIEFRHQVARLEPGTLGRRLRVDLEDDCSGRPNPFLDAGSPAPFASAAASCGAFLAARSASLRAASCCLACSSSVTASVPISVLSPHALVLLRWIGSA